MSQLTLDNKISIALFPYWAEKSEVTSQETQRILEKNNNLHIPGVRRVKKIKSRKPPRKQDKMIKAEEYIKDNPSSVKD